MNEKQLEEKAIWVKIETLELHHRCPSVRIASNLSDVEIFTVLYYGGILNFDPKNPKWEGRDRLVISKAHGAVSLYPILADLGFFPKEELGKIGQKDSILCAIPTFNIPGFETQADCLGHGFGVACGMALALKMNNAKEKVFCLLGDGELNEGSIWESAMFAGHHQLDNLIVIIDNNKKQMMGYTKDILDLEPLEDKFQAFKWKTQRCDGHNMSELYYHLNAFKCGSELHPKVLIADTIKGKGVLRLEDDPMCHTATLTLDEIDKAKISISEKKMYKMWE